MQNSSEEIKKAWEELKVNKIGDTTLPKVKGNDPRIPKSFEVEKYESTKLDLEANLFNWEKIVVELSLEEDDGWKTELDCEEASKKVDYNAKDDQPNYLNGCEDEINKMFNGEPGSNDTSIFETCAWYESFHYGNKDWGMNIYEDCLIKIAKHIKKYHNYKKEDCVLSAFLMIFCHELFHHLTDIAITSMELIKSDPNIYIQYTKNVYSVDLKKSPKGALEESLANRYVYGRYKSFKLNKHYLFNRLKREPIGYKHFDDFIGKKFTEGRRHLLNQAFECKSPSSAKLPYEHIYPLLDHKNFAIGIKMPVYIHRIKGSKEKVVFKIK
jgi:hypothetical protein